MNANQVPDKVNMNKLAALHQDGKAIKIVQSLKNMILSTKFALKGGGGGVYKFTPHFFYTKLH